MLALGCDHGGYELMQEIIKYLDKKNIPYKNFGTHGTDSVDYPIYAKKVTTAIQDGCCDLGLLICGTGIGISVAANKENGIICALCTNTFMAKSTKEHNNANILALGGRVTSTTDAINIFETFYNTPFSNEKRHINRINLFNS